MQNVILQPIEVGGQTFKNRIMFPPLTTGYEKNGMISEQDMGFYTRLAKGGVGYIVMGDVAPINSFSPTPKLFDDSQIPAFKALADSVHAYGTKLGVQLFHPEYDVDAINSLFMQKKFDEMRQRLHHDMMFFTDEVSEEMLMAIIDKMCACAVRAQKAGVDVIQIHGDRLNGCLCSTRMNHRTDKFGGSLENRVRFARMLTRAIRKAVPDMVIDRAKEIVEQLSDNDITEKVQSIAIDNKGDGKAKKQPKYDEVDLAQMSLFDTVTDEDVLKELMEIEVTTLTPLDALNTLYRLQNKLKNRWNG